MPGQVSQSVNQQLIDLNDALNKQVTIQNAYGGTGAQAIDQSYANLGGQLQQNLADTTQVVDSGRGGIQDAYNTSQGNIGNAANTLAQLGIGGKTFNSPQQEIQRLYAENAASNANSIASYNTLGTGYEAAGTKAIGDAATEGTNRKADLQSQIGANLSDLQTSYLANKSQLQGQLANALAQEEATKQAHDDAIAARDQAYNLALRQMAASAASRSSKDAQIGQGRSGLLQWAAENNVDSKTLDIIMGGINGASTTGKYQDAYGYAKAAAAQASVKPTNSFSGFGTKGIKAKATANAKNPPDINTINTGLDVYYGRYS